jgi:basic amino acid/polyamine antiporter, APA family
VSELERRLGLFDATMIVMGGIVGAGIFINPYVVAQKLGTPALILGAWVAGGVIALAGAFVYAELAALRPEVGGQYAYIREAYHPLAAFLYGWTLLLVTQTGGMAAVAVTFARYFRELTASQLPEAAVATSALAALTLVNCLGVRTGSNVQSAFMVLKILAILGLVGAGFLAAPAAPAAAAPPGTTSLAAFGAALVPVLFAYGGWQTASFISGELRAPERDLPRGVLLGVVAVIVLYLGVNAVCLRALGPAGLAATTTPASEVMRRALGAPGARLIAVGIAISTLGFLSQGMLTAPRVYFAMARDRVFFRSIAYVDPRTHVPSAAILLQGIVACVIALSGRYEQILNYVVSIDFLFFGLTATCLIVLRSRGERGPAGRRVPGHPWTTLGFVAACWLVAGNTVVRYPSNALIGVFILAAGVPAFFLWRERGVSR